MPADRADIWRARRMRRGAPNITCPLGGFEALFETRRRNPKAHCCKVVCHANRPGCRELVSASLPSLRLRTTPPQQPEAFGPTNEGSAGKNNLWSGLACCSAWSERSDQARQHILMVRRYRAVVGALGQASAPGMTRPEKTEKRMNRDRADIHPIYEHSLLSSAQGKVALRGPVPSLNSIKILRKYSAPSAQSAPLRRMGCCGADSALRPRLTDCLGKRLTGAGSHSVQPAGRSQPSRARNSRACRSNGRRAKRPTPIPQIPPAALTAASMKRP